MAAGHGPGTGEGWKPEAGGGSAEFGSFLEEAAVSSSQMVAVSRLCVFNVFNQEEVKIHFKKCFLKKAWS